MTGNRYRKAFTLIEVLIVVVIMAILAATVIPQFSSSTEDAKESSVNFNTRAMRSQIELYKVHHSGNYPTITAGDLPQLTSATDITGATGASGPAFPFGPYVDGELPNNPMNDLNTVVAGTGAAGDGTTGWQYNATTGGIWPNHTGWTP